MLDRKDICLRPEFYAQELAKKGTDEEHLRAEIERVVSLSAESKSLDQQIQEHNQRKNIISDLMKRGELDAAQAKNQASELGDISVIKDEIQRISDKLNEILLSLPNIPLPDTPVGGKDANIVIKSSGIRPEFDFASLTHIELAENLGLIDYKRGRKLSGKGFPVYTEKGAYLQRAIIQYCIDYHHNNGYKFLAVPHILSRECGIGAGQFPKFTDGVLYVVKDTHAELEKFLIPTAETAIANLYSGEILSLDQLPIKHFAESSCFRNETASHADERGIARTTEFKKVEMFQICHPKSSINALNEMISDVERLVEGLGLHFQLSKLGTLDCSASMQATYDVEVWIPSMNTYKEVSSVSLAGDYQARRTNTKFKDADKKNKYPHFLNASGLAVPRILMAILEQNQQENGSVALPHELRKYMYGEEVLASKR